MSLLGSFLKRALRAEPAITKPPNAKNISHRFICASRHSKKDFWEHSTLGKSLSNFDDTQNCEFSIAYGFTGNMCSYYNDFLDIENETEVFIFIMDHIGLTDRLWREKLDSALAQFNVVGIRGNNQLAEGQPTWWFDTSAPGSNTLSGSATLETKGGNVESQLGPSPMACKVLEPSFIAVVAKDLFSAEINFDPNMGQSFFALDFCKSAAKAGLSVGTWPIDISDSCALKSPLAGVENWSDYFVKYGDKWSASDTPK